jgi:hypothetical protein
VEEVKLGKAVVQWRRVVVAARRERGASKVSILVA